MVTASAAAPKGSAASSSAAAAGEVLPLVCVTGAAGYIATELCHQLLAKGYRVRATVRSAADEAKVGHLQRLAAALPGTLEVVEADLLAGPAAAGASPWDAAFAGCSTVFHTASPCILGTAEQLGCDPQALLIDPAVKGTRAVMEAAARCSVKRVVLTSSAGAVRGLADPAPPGGRRRLHSEEDWNEESTLESEPYCLSKVLAERAAWEAAEELGLDLVAILPQFVMGPVISARTDGVSVTYMKACLEPAPIELEHDIVMVDVRDVARAHILAAETPRASGRYLLAHTHTTVPAQLTAWLQDRFPQWDIQVCGDCGGLKESMDAGKVQRELGLHLRPLQETVVDMAASLVALGLAQPKLKPARGAE